MAADSEDSTRKLEEAVASARADADERYREGLMPLPARIVYEARLELALEAGSLAMPTPDELETRAQAITRRWLAEGRVTAVEVAGMVLAEEAELFLRGGDQR